MAWLKIDDRVRTHPKIVQAGPAAAWFWFCGICYCREHLTDGLILDAMLPTLAPGLAGWKKCATTLVATGLWHRVEAGYMVHDFLEWNPSRATVESQRAADRARKNGGFRTDSGQIPDGSQQDSSRARDAHTGLGSGSGLDPVLDDGSKQIVPTAIGEPPFRRGPKTHDGLIYRPVDWVNKHAGHTPGLCGWKCLFADQRAEFANGAGWTEDQVTAWAVGVRADFTAAGRAPTGKPYDFWNARWEERQGSSQAPKATSLAQLDPLAGVKELLRRG